MASPRSPRSDCQRDGSGLDGRHRRGGGRRGLRRRCAGQQRLRTPALRCIVGRSSRGDSSSTARWCAQETSGSGSRLNCHRGLLRLCCPCPADRASQRLRGNLGPPDPGRSGVGSPVWARSSGPAVPVLRLRTTIRRAARLALRSSCRVDALRRPGGFRSRRLVLVPSVPLVSPRTPRDGSSARTHLVVEGIEPMTARQCASHGTPATTEIG
jgi:hypothetical protein